jgi:CHAT domain-containing protein
LGARRATPRTKADTQTGIGDVYFFLGEKQKSLAAYQRAADLKRAAADKSGEALALIGTANVLSDLASRQKAADSEGDAGKRKGLEYYEKSLAIGRAAGDFSVQVFALMGAGVAYSALGDKTKATEYLNQALFFFGTAQFKPGEGWARYELARVERDRGNLAKALSLAGNARDIIESLRSKVISQDLRATFFAAVHDCFGLEVDVLMRMHAADPTKNIQADALAASERARARVLLETLGESQADIRQGADPALLERERELQALLNAKETARIQMLGARQPPELAKKMQAEVRDLAAQYEEVNNKIRASSPRYAALKFPQPLALKQIQEQVLDADTLLLEYALGDQRSFLWVVSTEGMTSWTLPKRSVIEEAARRYHASLIDPNKPASAESTKALSRMLLGEAAGVLGRKRLVIVADGALQYLPFAALLDPEGWQQPLVVNHEIVNLPSASTLAVLRRENANRKPAPKALAILADPVFTPDDPRVARALAGNRARESSKAVERSVAQRSVNDLGLEGIQLPRLPGTRREASGIAALVPEADRIQALDFDATRAVLTGPDAGQYRIIHLATHGLLNTTHPELSGIVLSLVDRQGKPQNGFLRLYEIYNLKLGADLVVLSACQTGLGKEIQGEGLVGLTRGFMYAGAPRVLASLWKVDDRATAELMKRLYGTMLGPNPLPPAAALRAAQIEMWKNKSFENPYYWAAFTLQGEWR